MRCRCNGAPPKGAAMDAGSVDDVIFLLLTFVLAMVMTLAIVIWGRVARMS